MARYRRILRHLWFVLALAPLPAWGGQAFIYVTNSAGDSIHVVDPATNKVVQEIKGIEAAHGIAPAPDGTRVYVSNEADSTLDVFDRSTGPLIKKVPLSNHPNKIAVSKNGDRIFVQLSDTNGFAVVDFAARKEVARIRLPKAEAEFETDAGRATSPSHGIGVAPDNKTLWVTSIPNNAVFVYSLADLKLIGEVALPALKLPGHDAIASVPNWVTFTPDSKTIYISNAAIKSVTAIDTESRTVKAVIPVGEVPKRITTLVTN